MKILLTGASGFVGKALLPLLAAEGHDLTLLSRQPHPGNFPTILSDVSRWAEHVRGASYDLCLHLAWIATPGVYLESEENKALADSTVSLANTLFHTGLPHFLALGTCIEYAPNQSSACSEIKTPVNPQSTYGLAKEKARAGIANSALKHRAGYTWVRLFYPYGVGEHTHRIPSIFLRTLRDGNPLVLKTPDSYKDFIEIQDVASALMHLAKYPPQAEINLGTGRGIRVEDLAKAAARLIGANPSLIQRAGSPGVDPYAFHVADSSKLSATGWKPQITLEKGMSRLLDSL